MSKKQQGWTDKELSDNKITELEEKISKDFLLSLDLEIQATSNLLENINVLYVMRASPELSNARIHTLMIIALLKSVKRTFN